MNNKALAREGMNNQKSDNSVSYPNSAINYSTTYKYTETSAYTVTGSAEKCTPDFNGPTNIGYVQSITTTESFAFNGTLTAEAKKVIKGSVSFTWTDSSASMAQVNGTFPVPAGKIGYVQFRPYLNCSNGSLRTTQWMENVIISDTVVNMAGYSPKTLSNGFTDGIFTLILR